MLRVAMVNLDRLHADPATGLLVDDVTLSGTTPTRGTTISTTYVAYTILGLRTALRRCSSQLELYSNNTPDTASSTPRSTPCPSTTRVTTAGSPSASGSMQIQRAEGELL